MGMSKAARMMMMGSHGKRDERYEHKDEYPEHKDKYGRDYERKEHDGKIRAGGTFWMDEPRKDMKFDRETAERWVSEMESRDGSMGGKWTYEQATQVMKQKGFDCDPVDFYAAMNSIYSDYGKTLTKYGVTAPEAYAELAYDWVKDPDAHKDKAARYYEYIVK